MTKITPVLPNMWGFWVLQTKMPDKQLYALDIIPWITSKFMAHAAMGQ
ncbi:MAG: hypothetical protein AB1665_05760 [Candidatus Thermoplasmatota archaeon]